MSPPDFAAGTCPVFAAGVDVDFAAGVWAGLAFAGAAGGLAAGGVLGVGVCCALAEPKASMTTANSVSAVMFNFRMEAFSHRTLICANKPVSNHKFGGLKMAKKW
jgi:hypothetical protein